MARRIVIVGTDEEIEQALGTLEGYDLEIESEQAVTYYVHKMRIEQQYGGPEEGGWWYDQRSPIDRLNSDYMEPLPRPTMEEAALACRKLNAAETARRDTLTCSYTSVHSYQELFFTYTVTESPVPEPDPVNRPHYE